MNWHTLASFVRLNEPPFAWHRCMDTRVKPEYDAGEKGGAVPISAPERDGTSAARTPADFSAAPSEAQVWS